MLKARHVAFMALAAGAIIGGATFAASELMARSAPAVVTPAPTITVTEDSAPAYPLGFCWDGQQGAYAAGISPEGAVQCPVGTFIRVEPQYGDVIGG